MKSSTLSCLRRRTLRSDVSGRHRTRDQTKMSFASRVESWRDEMRPTWLSSAMKSAFDMNLVVIFSEPPMIGTPDAVPVAYALKSDTIVSWCLVSTVSTASV
eukprot:2090350-Prymnesium_polylepis.1